MTKRNETTLKTTSYFTDDAGNLVLCRSGDLWTIGISFAHDETVQIEMTTEVARFIADFLLYGDNARAERDALAAKVAECEALMVELQPDPVLVGDSWIPFRDLAEVCENFMRSSAEHAREAKALAAMVDLARALHFESSFQSGTCSECDARYPCDTLRALGGTA